MLTPTHDSLSASKNVIKIFFYTKKRGYKRAHPGKKRELGISIYSRILVRIYGNFLGSPGKAGGEKNLLQLKSSLVGVTDTGY